MPKHGYPKTFLSLFLILALVAMLAVQAAPLSVATDVSTHTVLEAEQAATAPVPALSAASFVLYDPASKAFCAGRDTDTPRPVASTTKIMTALLVLEMCELDTVVTVPAQAVGIEGSSVYLFEGEQLTVRTLLYALMLSSANDAAVALALHAAGSIAAFADRMNERAAALGMTNTHFCNPHGLPCETHYSTARDMALLAAAALENETFAAIVSTKRYTAPQNGTGAERLFVNHNKLLSRLDGAVGVKTGFTRAGGRCLVSAATRGALTLVAVTLNAPDDWRDHTALLEWGFSQYRGLAPTPSPVTVPVVGGTQGQVRLLPAAHPRLTISANHPPITCRTEMPRFLYAGIRGGQVCGRALYYAGDTLLCEIPLTAECDVPTSPRPSLWERIKNRFQR